MFEISLKYGFYCLYFCIVLIFKALIAVCSAYLDTVSAGLENTEAARKV